MSHAITGLRRVGSVSSFSLFFWGEKTRHFEVNCVNMTTFWIRSRRGEQGELRLSFRDIGRVSQTSASGC